MARVYLGAFWNRGDRRGAAGFVLGTLGYCAVVGIGDGSILGSGVVMEIGGGPTLGDGAMVGIGDGPLGVDVVGDLVSSDIASIPCRILMDCIFHPLL